jgi:predicted nuclease of predicted toxin-antitoxin system
VLRRGYGNHATLAKTWQDTLVEKAFTPCLQFQYAAGKNTADIALALDALEAMFDGRAEKFCIVTSDSDFAYLCRKLRERGAAVSIVGEAKAPNALRNASDQFFEWVPEPAPAESDGAGKPARAAGIRAGQAAPTVCSRGCRIAGKCHHRRPGPPLRARPVSQTHRSGIYACRLWQYRLGRHA